MMMNRALRYNVKLARLLGSALLLSVFWAPSQAAAQCCGCVDTVQDELENQWFDDSDSTTKVVRRHVEGEFTSDKQYLVGLFWEDNILPSMMAIAEQISAVALYQAQIIGSFFDAEQQMDTQRRLQRLQAQAHKDYRPSEGLCEFGSNAKSLAASARKGEVNAAVMARRSKDRSLGAAGTVAAAGEGVDSVYRLEQFKTTFCDPANSSGALALICDDDTFDPDRANRDVDYVRVFAEPLTLDVDFTDIEATPQEADILAMAANIYNDKPFSRHVQGDDLKSGQSAFNAAQESYMDMRAVVAKRSVAENSFNAVAAMKSAGSGASRAYMEGVLQELGAGSAAEIGKILGDVIVDENGQPAVKKVNPSYYAQMEILTKKIYQNPDFYTNLYDSPANVGRKGAAMQAVELMQKFDMLESYLRQEAIASMMLELAVVEMQKEEGAQ